jgi:hypothetical protein
MLNALSASTSSLKCCLQEFPPTSKLDPKVYGNQNSAIREEHIENNMNGQTVDQVLNTLHMFPHYIYITILCSTLTANIYFVAIGNHKQ